MAKRTYPFLFEIVQHIRAGRGAKASVGGFRLDDRGSVAILASVTIPVLIGVGAMAVTTHNVANVRADLQNAIDAAVLAGASDLNGESSAIATSGKYFTANLSRYSKVSSLDIATDFSVQTGAVVHGTATAPVKTAWSGFLGLPATVAVRVTAQATGSRGNLCVLGLDSFGSGAFDINGNAKFIAPSCAVQTNSSASDAMTMEGRPTAEAKTFGVSGGSTGGGYSPAPLSGTAKIKDPYESIPFPSSDHCSGHENMQQIKVDTVLSPGTYCGGLHIFSSAHVTLASGIYVMNGGPLWINGNSTVTGDQVMIAFTGDDSTLYLTGNSTMSVTSRTSGTYANMSFFQDRTQEIPKAGTGAEGVWFSVGGGKGGPENSDIDSTDASKLTFDGTAYLPTQNWWIYGKATVEANSPTMAIVAGKLWTQGDATVKITTDNKRGIAVDGVPQLIYAARLIK